MNLELRVEQLGEEHIEPYLRLSKSEYGEDAAISQSSHLRWKFLQNPQGSSVGINLYNGSEIVGRLVAMPRTFICKGIAYKAAFMADLVIERTYRGMYPMLQLVEGLKRLAGFDLILLTPNPQATAVWEKLFEMPSHFDFGVSVAPLRPARIAHVSGKVKLGNLAVLVDWPWGILVRGVSRLGSLLSAGRVVRERPSQLELEELLSIGAGSTSASGLRSLTFFEWRFRRSPVFHYDIDFLRKSGTLVGYLVTRRGKYDGYDCRFVVDAFAQPGANGIPWRPMQFMVVRNAAKEGAEMAIAIGNTNSGVLADFSRLPFIEVPRRVLPRKMKLYGTWLSREGFPLWGENFDLTLADFDMV